MKRFELNNGKSVIFQRSFPTSLREFVAHCDHFNSHFRSFPNQVKKGELNIGEKRVTINLYCLKNCLEYLSIKRKLGYGSKSLKNCDEVVPSAQKERRFCDYSKLEEIKLVNFAVNKVLIQDNTSLKKISILFNFNWVHGINDLDLSIKHIEISNLPNIESLALEKQSENINIRNCPSLKKCSLRKCKLFPKDVDDKSKLEGLVLDECTESVLSDVDNKIDGDVFKKLKYLIVCQKWNFIHGSFAKDDVPVRELVNLEEMYQVDG